MQLTVVLIRRAVSGEREAQDELLRIPHEGEIPTPEEWLYYAVNYLIEHGDRELLRWYPNL